MLRFLSESTPARFAAVLCAGILKEGGRVARDARVTLEYTPLQGLNAGRADAAALVDFCRDIGLQWLHVNLM